ncbi:hypothetical protein ACFVYF_34715 [Streptomyces sp. NPDC058274]|uniref:hypothetical protein n=1 Tax=Streptomyces sp. NPDC058274 TaxID=3346416 RepID=UPI0036E2D8FE
MEQRIGSNSQPLDGSVVPVVPVAAADPAYIPGITSPAPAAPEDAAADADAPGTATAGTDGEDSVPEKGVPGSSVSGRTASDGTASEGTVFGEESAPGEASAEAADEDEEGDPEPDGPVFEASDRRASIKADHSGVQLRLDDQQAEFRWDEIGAVETESPRFGKRFTITVHTPDRRWYPIEIEATARARFAEWEGQLDAVLDAYFDDGTEDDADAVDAHDADAVDEASEASEAAENEVTAEATKSKPSKPSKKSMADKAVESDKAGDEPVAADD